VIPASETEAKDRPLEADRATNIIIADYKVWPGKTGIEAMRHIRARYCK
jgi:hypothetical protein